MKIGRGDVSTSNPISVIIPFPRATRLIKKEDNFFLTVI
jgi:hypothetical protein